MTDIDFKGLYQDEAVVEGVTGVPELHVWRPTQNKAIAALHLNVDLYSLTAFMKLSQTMESLFALLGRARSH